MVRGAMRKILYGAILAAALVGMAGCSTRADDLTIDQPIHDPAATRTPVARTGGDRAVGMSPAAARPVVTPAPGVVERRPERDLSRLLTAAASPPELIAVQTTYLGNNEVAALFADPEAVLDELARRGRSGGVRADYELRPLTGATSVRVAFSVDVYRSGESAAAVLADPALAAAIGRLVPGAAELPPAADTAGLRAFRGALDGGQATYIVQFRKEHLVGSVVVTQPAATDDGGALALRLAGSQQSLLVPAAVQADGAGWLGATAAQPQSVAGGTR